MDNARKYILNMSDVISCGIGSNYDNTVQCNSLSEFTIQYSTTPPTSHTYPEITTEDLKSLSVLEYEQRIIDYIDSIEIDNAHEKDHLLTNASFEEDDCASDCLLNPNFVVYKFLSGIRVVNIGRVNGIAQYRTYPIDANPNDYSWQTNGTFLNLDQNGIYNVEIRDYLDNVEICKISKIVSMPLLIPSTTVVLQNKLIRLNENSQGDGLAYAYRNGFIGIAPILTTNEIVNIDYEINTTAIGDGTSCVQLMCRPNGTVNFENYACFTNLNGISPRTGSIEMCHGDTVCYNVLVDGAEYGSDLNADFSITSVDGLGTSIPSIDLTSCSSAVSKCIIPLWTSVSFDYQTTCASTVHNTTGVIDFSNPIPEGQCVTINLTGTNVKESDASSYTEISCRPNGGSQYLPYYSLDSESVQPQTPTLVACYGDSICYNITVSLNVAGSPIISTADVSLSIDHVNGTLGVNPVITDIESGNTITDSISSFTPDIILSVCRSTTPTSTSSTGFINLDPPLTDPAQLINANFDVCQVVCGFDNNETHFTLYREAPLGGVLELFNVGVNSGDEEIANGSFSMEYGYIYCYCNSVDNVGEYACSEFRITSVASSTNSPQIDTQVGKDRDVLSEGL